VSKNKKKFVLKRLVLKYKISVLTNVSVKIISHQIEPYKAIRFSCLPKEYIVNDIACDKLFGGECSQTVMKGMSYHLLSNAKFENQLSNFYPRKSKPSVLVVGSQISSNKNPFQFYKNEKWNETESGNHPNLQNITGLEIIVKKS